MTYIDPLHEPEEPDYYGVPLDDHDGGLVAPVWILIGALVVVILVVAWKVWR